MLRERYEHRSSALALDGGDHVGEYGGEAVLRVLVAHAPERESNSARGYAHVAGFRTQTERRIRFEDRAAAQAKLTQCAHARRVTHAHERRTLHRPGEQATDRQRR